VHHLVLERWSRRDSFLHRRDPRAKILALLALLVSIATVRRAYSGGPLGCLLLLLMLAAWSARLPGLKILARAAVVLPFALSFAIASVLSGERAAAGMYLAKSYLSAVAVLLVVATTPLAALIRGLEGLGAPRFLLMVSQFLYRYLFVISEEAQHMRAAAAARGGRAGFGRLSFAAARAIGVLFARSYERAGRVHRAMLARGFAGHYSLLRGQCFRTADGALVAVAAAVAAGLRLAEAWL